MAVVSAIAVIAWIAYLAVTRHILEDALITYRYAENLALGNGFVFNPGERVLGTTSPLQALLLAGGGTLFGVDRIPHVSNVLMIASALLAGLLTFRALLRAGVSRGTALLALILFFFHPDVAWSSTGGMETPLVLLFMAATLDAAVAERKITMGIAGAALLLARIDGLVWYGALLVAVGIRRPRFAAGAALVTVLAVLPWVAFAAAYFGSPLPHSMIAKMRVAEGEGPLAFARLATVQSYLTWVLRAVGDFGLGAISPIQFILWFPCLLVGAGAVVRRWAQEPLLVLVIFPVLFVLAFLIGRAPHFRWYLVPLTWNATVVGALGISAVRGLLTAYARKHRLAGRVATLAAGTAALVLASAWVVEYRDGVRFHRQFQENENATRKVIGMWLREHADANATVAMEAIGYQGATSRRRVIDMTGLVSPGVVRLRRASRSNAELFHRILVEYGPDYLVLRSFEVDENRHRDGGPLFESEDQREYFEGRYRERARYTAPHPTLWAGSARLTLFQRRDAPGA